MQLFKEKTALREAIASLKQKGCEIGLVPTMGALHEGHLSLVRQALTATQKVVVSIFVNPTQFNNQGDLQHYPRTLDKDLSLLSEFEDNILVFAPLASEIYEGKLVSHQFSFDGLEKSMEGKFRIGHFDGVGTIVKILFEIIQPSKAFFGEKDYQQLQIIKKLVEKRELPVEIIGCPISREPSGLARSSRNKMLSAEDRKHAAFIYQTLVEAKKQFGTKSALEVKTWAIKVFQENPFLKLEYFEIAEAQSLKPIETIEKGKQYRAFVAAFMGKIRLIDNIALN